MGDCFDVQAKGLPGGSNGLAGDVKQPDGRAIGLVPAADGFRGGIQLNVAFFLGEIVGSFIGEFQHTGLTGSDNDAGGAVFVDVLRFGKRYHMRGAIDLLGELLSALFDLTVEADNDVIFVLLAGNGDRAKFGFIDLGFHPKPHKELEFGIRIFYP